MPIALTCADAAAEPGPDASRERIVVARSPLHCRWEGIDVPVYRIAGNESLVYVPPLRPDRAVTIDRLTDPSGRTLRIRLRGTVPDLPRACGVEPPDARARELADARPMWIDAASVALAEPVSSEQCVLARAGMPRAVGGDVVVRVVLPSVETSRAFVRAVRAPAGDLSVRVRYRIPAAETSAVSDAAGIEMEHVARARSCAESCDGCCSSRGDCIAREGGDPSECESPVRVTIERVRLTSGNCGPVDGQCDYIVVVTSRGGEPISHGLGDDHNDVRTALPILEVRASEVIGSTSSIRVLDDDEYVDDGLGSCEVTLSRAQVLAAITSRDGVRLEVACGQVTLTIRARTHAAEPER